MDDYLTTSLLPWIFVFGPGVLATVRGHRAAVAIWALTLIALAMIASLAFAALGALVWLVALVWALGANTDRNSRRDAEAVARAMNRLRR